MGSSSEKKMKDAWLSGKVCLHPTDTLPGLSFNPNSEQAWRRLSKIKKRDESKTCISLVASLDFALGFWRDLPGVWSRVLADLWPSSLSVIWQANNTCPKTLVRESGTVAFRCPPLLQQNQWLLALIESVGSPFPTTSVNCSGEPAANDFGAANHFLDGLEGVYIPEEFEVPGGQASTLIEIFDDSSFRIHRPGPCSEGAIKEALKRHGTI